MSASLLREYLSLMIEKVRTKKNQKGVMGSKFDLKKFKSLPDERAMVAYAAKFLQKIGEGGSSRTAFLLSSKYALKIALNKKGFAQNESELNVFTGSKGTPVVTRVYGADDDNRWLIVDLVKELDNPDEFSSLSGTDWSDFTATVLDQMGRKGTKTMRPDEFTGNVINFARQHNLLPGDLEKIEHWGKTPDGRVVLLDYGLTRDVWDNHYADNQMPQAQSAASDAKTSAPGKVSDTSQDPKAQKTAPSGNRTKPAQYSLDGKTGVPKKNAPSDEKTVAPRKKAVGANDTQTQPSQYKHDPRDEKTRR